MKKMELVLSIGILIILSTACTPPASRTPLVSTPNCSNKGLTISTFLSIKPGQTSVLDVEKLLGDEAIPIEPLLTEWTLIYLCDTDDEVNLLITFDAVNEPSTVKELKYYNPHIDLAEIINLLGSPELVYKEYLEEQAVEGTKYTLAYPSVGIYASIISTSKPISTDEVTEILKELPQNLQQFITELSKRKDVEIIEWSLDKSN